jgi:hypothetical protein
MATVGDFAHITKKNGTCAALDHFVLDVAACRFVSRFELHGLSFRIDRFDKSPSNQ